jgi:hypothetical protein
VHDGFVIGRVAGCDLVIDDTKASRRHARLVVDAGVVEVEDLESSNGTLLNEKPVTRRVLREKCHLFAPERLWMRTVARAAYRGTVAGVKRPDAAWLELMVADSVRDLLGEDRQEEQQLVPLDEHTQHDYAMLTELLGIPQNRARLAAVRFNDLEFARRRIVFRAVVEGWSIDRCVEDGLGTREHVESELRAALAEIARTREHPIEPRLVDEHGEPLL